MPEHQQPRIQVVTDGRDLAQRVDGTARVQVLDIARGVAKRELTGDTAIQAK